MTAMDMQTVMDRQTFRYAVGRQILCPITREVLDVSTAVEVTVTDSAGKCASTVIMGSAWDEISADVKETAARHDCTVTVVDGRELFGKGAETNAKNSQ